MARKRLDEPNDCAEVRGLLSVRASTIDQLSEDVCWCRERLRVVLKKLRMIRHIDITGAVYALNAKGAAWIEYERLQRA
jgi:hypothetical protein